MKVKNKKVLIILILLFLVGSVSSTIAYFSSSAIFDNEFKTLPYNMEYVEYFNSPSDWTPGTTTRKTAFSTNLSDLPVLVRLSYEASWVDKNNNELPLTLPNGEDVAILNFTNPAEGKPRWFKLGDYYYYDTVLQPYASTANSFINSVTYNPNVVNSETCTTNNNVTICESTAAEYDGATYSLKINFETIQLEAIGSDGWEDVQLDATKNKIEPVLVEETGNTEEETTA